MVLRCPSYNHTIFLFLQAILLIVMPRFRLVGIIFILVILIGIWVHFSITNVAFVDESKKTIKIITYKKFHKTGIYEYPYREISLKVFKVEYWTHWGKRHFWQLCLYNTNNSQWFAVMESVFMRAVIKKGEKLRSILGCNLETGQTKKMLLSWHNDLKRRSV